MKSFLRRVIAVLLIVTAGILVLVPAEDSYATVAVGDFEMDGSTVVKYNGTTSNVTLPNTVTKIGKSAFAGNTNIVRVTIPDSVRELDFACFENCINLEYVSIPNSVRAIGSSAFSGCSSLSDINIPEKTSEIGSAAFARCNSLSKINLDGNNPYFSFMDGVLYSKDGTKLVQYLAGRTNTSYSMPSSVDTIEEYAFWGAGNLINCTISNNVKEIPEYAFDNCSGLTNMALPYGVESLMAFSFADCTSLTNIVIPDSVGYIDENAFYLSYPDSINFVDQNGSDSDSISSINGSNDGDDFDNANSDGNLLKKDYNGNFVYYNDNPYVSSMTKDYSDNTRPGDIGATKIVGGSALVMLPSDVKIQSYNIELAEKEDSVASSGSITTFADDDFTIINNVLCKYNGNKENVVIPNGVKAIGDRVFYKNSSIKSVEIPDSVTSIGDFSFARSSLSSVNIPSSVNVIDYAAFYNCDNLFNVNIPTTVSTIEMSAFDGTKWLDNWRNDPLSDNYLIEGDGILLAYKGEDTVIDIPAGVKTVGSQCFYNNKNITAVDFPNSLLKVGEDSFNGCIGINNVNLPNSLREIEDRAFKNTSITNVSIPASVSNIGLGAFDNTATKPLSYVAFLGSSIPELSYKPTATRLSASDLRSMSFEGVKTALINSDAVIDLNNSNVLSEYEYGFRGQIYLLKSNDGVSGMADLAKATVEPDNYGAVNLTSSFIKDDIKYYMSGALEHAFDSYPYVEAWSGKAMYSIALNGNTSDELDEILSNIPLSDAKSHSNSPELISVEIYGEDFPQDSVVNASIDGNNDKYILKIEEEPENDELFWAFYSAYGSINNYKIISLSISLVSPYNNIELKKLATGKMIITMPVPLPFTGIDGLKVATVNDNGALEIVSSERIDANGQDSLRFIASHLSPYAIFYELDEDVELETISSENTPSITITNNNFFSDNQSKLVVKTLNKKVGSIEAKWFVIVILVSLAMILLLWKGKKKKIK